MSEILDCIIVGYKQYTIEERLLASGCDESAQRCCKRQYISYNGKLFYYHDLISYLKTNDISLDVEKEYRRNYFSVNEIPYLALLYLMNFLRIKGISSEVINLFDCEKSKLTRLLDKNPLAVAISSTAYTNPFPLVKIVKFIREHNRDIKIIVGGPYLYCKWAGSNEAEFAKVMRLIGADYYIVEPQGEKTLVQLLSALKDRSDTGAIKNLYSLDKGSIKWSGIEREDNNLNENSIDWDAVDDNLLGPTLNLRTARGCARQCSFCNYPVRNDRLNFMDIETVAKELSQISRKGFVKNLIYIDDTFNIPRNRFKDLCRMMINHNFLFRWFSYFRIAEADEESIKLMKESGCGGVFLGLESGDDGILKNMNKVARVDDYKRGLELLNKYEIPTFGFFLIGFPGETERSVQNTIEFIKSSGLTLYTANLWYADVTTPIFRERGKYKLTGADFHWRHETMDHRLASDWCDMVFLSNDDPIWTPGDNFGYWSIPYLLGKGFSFSQIKDFLVNAKHLVEANFDQNGRKIDIPKLIGNISRIIHSHNDQTLAEPLHQ